MSTPRQPMLHPGPRSETRVEVLPVRLRPLEGTLRAGELVMDEVSRVFREASVRGGVLTMTGGRCEPFRFVIPDHSHDGAHAAWYSRTYAPEGGGAIDHAVAIVGGRDGAPFLHCHGRWRPADPAMPTAGHLLPFETIVSEDIAVSGFGATAMFESVPDAETAFTLFSPRGSAAASPDGLLLRIRPGEDVVGSVDAACAGAGFTQARVHGIGSVNVVVYGDRRTVACHATEILIEGGTFAADGEAHLPVTVVDIAGEITSGVLARGENPVGVTFELVVEAL